MNKNFRSVTILVLAILVFAFCYPEYSSFAQPKAQKIDNLMQACYKNGQFNGAVFVAEHGKIIYDKSFGIANIETKEKIKSNSQFRLGSVSKQFTSMAIMMLKERGKLNYDDDIRKFLPELPYQGITIRHLLTHTSGLPDYMSLFDKNWDVDKKDTEERKIAANKDALNLFATYHPEVLFKPGERWEYSNTGYVMLALIVERASGKEFDQFLSDNIFKPLNMSHTLVFSPLKNQKMEHRVYGYQLDLNGVTYSENDFNYLNGIAGDGGIYSTTNDLFKWDQSLYTEKLVDKSTLKEAFTPVKFNNDSTYSYGFGWRIDKTKGGKMKVSHTGGWVGFRTSIDREIEDTNTIIILTNHSSIYRNEIRTAIASILHNQEYMFPKISIAQVIGQILVKSDVDSAIKKYHELKREYPDKYNFSEKELNNLGYQLIGMKRIKEAIEIFKLNVGVYPESYNTYDSLGEVYMLNGQKDLAIKNYAQSLVLNPKNVNAIEKLYKIIKE